MTPRLTSEDCRAAHEEREAENLLQLRQNRFYCLELNRRELEAQEGREHD